MATKITSTALAALDVSVRANFQKAYQSGQGYKPWADMVAARVPSSSTKNVYPLVVDSGAIQEWTSGPRDYYTPVMSSFELTNKKYSLGVACSREWIEDDQTGLLLPAIRSAARKFLIHPDALLAAVINANPLTLDGVALFSATHFKNGRNSGGGTFSNAKTSRALTVANVATTRAELLALTGPDGFPMINPGARLTIIVPPSLERTAREIAFAMYANDSVTSGLQQENVMRGMYDVLVIPQLESLSATTWYMADLSDPDDRPLIFQERTPLEESAKVNLSDDNVVDLDEYRWAWRVRYVAGPGNPWKIQRCAA